MNRVEVGLIANIEEEKEAVSSYRKLATLSKRHHLPKTAVLFTHIADQEAHHKRELTNALKSLRKGKKK